MTESPLNDLLRRVSLRQRADAALTVGAISAAALAVMLGAAIALDAAVGLDAWLLVLIDVVWLACLISSAATVTHRATVPIDPRGLARLVEERSRITDGSLIAAVELSAASTPSGGSPALRGLAIQRGERAAAGLDPRTIVGLRSTRRALGTASAVVMIAIVAAIVFQGVVTATLPRFTKPWADLPPYARTTFSLTLSPIPLYADTPATIAVQTGGPVRIDQASVVMVGTDDPGGRRAIPMTGSDGRFTLALERAGERRRFYIRTPAGRSRWFALDPIAGPAVTSLTLRESFPAYTGWPDRPIDLPADGSAVVRVLAGTRLTLLAHGSRPLRTGAATLQADTVATSNELSPVSGDPSVAQAPLPLNVGGRLTVSLTAADGTAGPPVPGGKIEFTSDTPPHVEITEPAGDVVVPLGWPVRVTARASDDVAVAAMEWKAETPSGTVRVPMQARGLGGPEAQATLEIDPAKLGCKVGDRLTGQVLATDNFPGAGPGGKGHEAASVPLTIRIVSDQEYRTLAKAAYGSGQAVAERERFARAMADAQQRHDALAGRMKGQNDAAEETPEESAFAEHASDSDATAAQMKERAKPPHLDSADESYASDLRSAANGLEAEAEASRSMRAAFARLHSSAGAGDPAARAALTAALSRFEQNGPALHAARDRLERAAADAASSAQANDSAGTSGAGRATVIGPHAMQSVTAPSPNEGPAGPSRAEHVARSQTRPSAEMSLNVASVPEQYRVLAEAYFRRLAEDGGR